MTTPSLIAVFATEPESRRRDALAHPVWGDRLTVEQFVDRQDDLRATPFSRRAMATWLLIEEGDDARRALASLETFEVPCRHGLRVGRAFQIASVFTEPALRGRGYASRLLEEVARACSVRRGALAMTLYSDVGAAFYERVGYAARPAFEWSIPVGRDAASGVVRRDGDADVTAALAAHPVSGRFAIQPTADQIGWHRARERVYAGVLGRPLLRHPVLTCDGGYALLCGDAKNERAMVLAWWARDVEAAARLCSAAADEARAADYAELVAWAEPDGGGPFEAVLPVLGATRAPRDGSLPMLRALPRAPGLEASAWREIPKVLWV